MTLNFENFAFDVLDKGSVYNVKPVCEVLKSSDEGAVVGFKIDKSNIGQLIDGKLKTISQKVKLDGFRPGKAPLNVVRKLYLGDALNDSFRDICNHLTMAVINHIKRDFVSLPEIDPKEISDEKMDLHITFEYYPEFDLPKFDSIKLETLKYKPSDDEVEKYIARIKEVRANFEVAPKNHVTANGDAVMLDCIGKLDGVAFPEGEVRDHRLVLGSGAFIPGFEDQLIGKKAGDDVLVKVTFPTDYHVPNLAGKPAEFETKIKEVLIAKTVSDEEFATGLGFKSFEDFKNFAIENLVKNFEGLAYDHNIKKLFDKLDPVLKFKAPTSLLNREREIVKNIVASDAKYSDKSEKEKEELVEGLASRRVRLAMLIGKVSKENKIEVTSGDINAHFMDLVNKHPQMASDLYKALQNKDFVERMKSEVFERKISNFMLDATAKQEKTVSAEELTKIVEADEYVPA